MFQIALYPKYEKQSVLWPEDAGRPCELASTTLLAILYHLHLHASPTELLNFKLLLLFPPLLHAFVLFYYVGLTM